MTIEFEVNGVARSVDVDDDTPLLWVLRDTLGLTGTKFGCGRALCGACTVHVDGEAVRACAFPARHLAGRKVTTIESLESTSVGAAVVQAWIDHDVVQCGWCQPGQCMAAAALVSADQSPDDEAIDGALAGNLCRCGTYPRIRQAVKTAADIARREGR